LDDVIARQSLRTLIGRLVETTNKLDVGVSSGRNKSLSALGAPLSIALSFPLRAQGVVSYRAQVVHTSGTSNWTISFDDNGDIVSYDFEVSLNDAHNHGASQYDTRGSATIDAVAPPPPVADPRVVEFLFASTRRQVSAPSDQNISYSGERGPLTYGAASVRIPDDHKIGRIELPSSWRLFGISLSSAPNEHEHFLIKRAVKLSEESFADVVEHKAAKSALIFVHGFNVSFEDALYRTAQIVWDLQYGGLAILFTWASRGESIDYLYDRESAYLARDAFINLLGKLRKDYRIEQVNVLAHSMGNIIALDALASNAQSVSPIETARLIMAAPDVDRDLFGELVRKAKASIGDMTLYASSADKAMMLSRRLAGGVPRAGDVPLDGPIVLPALETIDVTAVGEDIFGLNHNVFAASRDVMEDIGAMLRLNLPSPRLIQIRAAPEPPQAQRYWKYVR
jgi:esterase/lipase superfamily enzyme